MLFWLWPLERHLTACMRSLRLVILSLLGAALLVLGAACGGGDDDAAETNGSGNPDIEVPADAVAVVAGTPIPRADYDRLFAQAENAYEAQQREFPAAGTPEYEQLKNQTVEFLIDRVIREKEAAALGIEVTDQEVADRLTELKQQFFEGDEQKYQDELEAQGVTEEDVLADLRAQLISQKIFDQVTADVTVTDDEVQQYYDDNEEQFTTPESREVAHILVDANDKKLADDLYQQLQDGADFAELAKEHSTDTASAEQGGQLTDVRGSFVPEFEDVAFALETGEIGEPVKSQFGWHIITALEDTQPEATTPFAEVSDSVREQLLDEQKDALMLEWVRDARTKHAATIGFATGFEPATTATLPDLTGATETGSAAETGS
jgi:parvulin-like peptidyl-prolyl isomerase